MARYADELKYKIILRMMPPNNESATEIARDSEFSEGILYKWQKEARANGFVIPGGEKEAEKRSEKDKFSIVVETVTLSEIEREIKNLARELKRKYPALAETAVLLVLRKKARERSAGTLRKNDSCLKSSTRHYTYGGNSRSRSKGKTLMFRTFYFSTDITALA